MHAFPGRLLLMFQPHGYGPIRHMRNALVDCFASGLHDEDVLTMPEPSISAARSTAASEAPTLLVK
jgi:UDP-N-acetylmuramate--alanine ligase